MLQVVSRREAGREQVVRVVRAFRLRSPSYGGQAWRTFRARLSMTGAEQSIGFNIPDVLDHLEDPDLPELAAEQGK